MQFLLFKLIFMTEHCIVIEDSCSGSYTTKNFHKLRENIKFPVNYFS